MNIYKVERTTSIEYDEYDEFIVSANNEDEARNTHPSHPNMNPKCSSWRKAVWPDPPESLKVTLLGSSIFSEVTVHCTSFNAG